MRIELKLIATYRRFLPSDCQGNTWSLEVGPATQPAEVLRRFGVPTDGASVILVNGRTPLPEQVLNEGDVLCAFPAIAGG